jgi:gliding motility-associated-like protein
MFARQKSFNFIRKLWSIAFVLQISLIAKAQVVADFTANSLQGCAPMIVDFSDLSGPGITSRIWDFGLGSPIVGNDSTPIYTYVNPGCYDVTLIVSDGNTTDTLTRLNYICAKAGPQADFSTSNDTICQEQTIIFSDQSIPGDTGISQLTWYFGDGSDTVLFGSAEHTYASTGIQTVCLIAIDSSLCENTFCDTVFVLASPVADFSTLLSPYSCSIPFDVDFLNQSTGATSYQWSFEGGGTSIQTNPQNTYSAVGSYDVALIAVNNAGCADTMLKLDYVLTGLVNGSVLFSRDSICSGETLLFTSASVGDSALQWNWACCGLSSSNATDSILFPPSSSGFYSVQLILYGFGNCTDTIYDSVYVDQIQATFTQNASYSCQTPFLMQVNDLSTSGSNIDSWIWTFGDGDSSFVQNPSHTYQTDGNFSISLSVTNTLGCSSQISQNNVITIFEVQPTITVDHSKGCKPLTVQFTGGEQNNFIDSIQSWSWNFDDPSSGLNNASVLQSPSHTFNDTGRYIVVLMVLDSSGCTHSDSLRILVGDTVHAAYSIPDDTVCAKDPVVFFDQSTDSLYVNEWAWTWSLGGTDSIQSGTHLFTDTGFVDLILVVGHNGCYDTLMADSVAYIAAPIVELSSSLDCTNPLEINFMMIEKGAQRWYWDFGDASPIDSVSMNPTHVYASTGDYTVTVIAYNDSTGCDFTATLTVHVRQVSADFLPTSTISCNDNAIPLDGSPSVDANSYVFSIENDTMSYPQMNLSYVFQDTGFFDIKLLVEALNGCKDSMIKTFSIRYIQANFGFDSAGLCVPLTVQFTDSSYSENGIAQWSWIFGNGGIDSIQNPSTVYNSAGTYHPILSIEDSIGCILSYQSVNPVVVYGPVFSISLSDSIPCVGQDIIFQNNSYNQAGGSLSYLWNFGDGDTSTAVSPTHAYASAGYYNISLIASDPFYGCIDTLELDSLVQVQTYPTAGFWADPPFIGCFPDCILFYDSSSNAMGNISQWEWDFGDGTSDTSSTDSISHCYTTLGLFDVSLIVTSTGGCTDTLIQPDFISVYGPTAQFHITPDSLCKGDEIMLIIDNLNNVSDFDWDFGDGQYQANVLFDTTYHVYDQVGLFYPKLIYRSDSTCQKVKQDSIFIYLVEADFLLSDTSICLEQANIQTINQSLGADSWSWNFGDATNIANVDSVNHTYLSEGLYSISLAIENTQTGCRDTAFQSINIIQINNAGIPDDVTFCLGDSATLSILGPTIDSAWWSTSSAYISDSVGLSILSSATNDALVFVTVSDDKGCILLDTVRLIVIEPFQASIIYPNGGDTLIVIGTSANILVEVNGNANPLYLWTPNQNISCDQCPNPIASPLTSQEYFVYINDSLGCFDDTLRVFIEVIEEFKASVPTAFSPNGDGENEIVYVRGWGIKTLLEFNIYNRWGELVYQNPGDLLQGWDGKYKGEVQAQDSYAVTVKATGYNNQLITYEGFINIIR